MFFLLSLSNRGILFILSETLVGFNLLIDLYIVKSFSNLDAHFKLCNKKFFKLNRVYLLLEKKLFFMN